MEVLPSIFPPIEANARHLRLAPPVLEDAVPVFRRSVTVGLPGLAPGVADDNVPATSDAPPPPLASLEPPAVPGA
jgi:hypothetical protein